MRRDRRTFPSRQGTQAVTSNKEETPAPHDIVAKTEETLVSSEPIKDETTQEEPNIVEEDIPELPIINATVQESRDIQLLRFNLEQMKDALTTQSGIISDANIRRYADKLNAVCKALTTKNMPELFDVYLQFHIDNRETICNERTALIGTAALRRPDHDRISLVYHIFRTIALRGSIATLDPGTCLSVFGESPAIMAYISRKLS